MKQLFIIFILLFLPGLVTAQAETATGTITGRVIDGKTNKALTGANVILINTSMGAATGPDGFFTIDNVPVGTYTIQVQVIGYEPVTESDVVVTNSRPVQLDFSLKETVIQFEALTVRPDYFPKDTETLQNVQIQTNEEIRRLPGGFEDVVRAVSILPGVAQVDAGRNDLIVRGGAPSENLYVLDGIEIPNINHFGTQGSGGGPQSYINLDYVKKTSFSTGGFGVRYGDKLSSVLNIDLREGRRDQLGGKATISATQFGLDIEGPVTDKGSFFVTARRSYLDFIFKAAGFGFVPEYWDFMSKTSLELSRNDRLEILGVVALDNIKIFNDTREQRLDNSQILANRQNQAVGGITWKHFFSSGYSTLTLGQTLVDFDQQQSDTLLNPIFTNTSLEHENTITNEWIWFQGPQSQWKAGVQGKWIRLNSDILLPTFTTEYGEEISLDASTDTTTYKAAAWLEWSGEFNRVSVGIGARLDAFDMLESKFVAAPRLSLEYRLNNLTSLSGSVGRYYQSPSYIWLMTNPENRTLDFIGADQVILGIRHLIRDDTQISLEGYYKSYFNYPTSLARPYLILANTGAGFGGAQNNFGSFGFDPLVSEGTGIARGVELFVQKKLSQVPLYGTLSISYNHTDFTALDGTRRPGSFDQRWIINVGGGYKINEQWEVSSRFRYATGRPYTPLNPDLTRSANLYNSARLDANHFLDIRVDRRWFINGWSLVTYIDVQNVYNRKSSSIPEYNAYSDEIETRSGIGILPSIGISAEL